MSAFEPDSGEIAAFFDGASNRRRTVRLRFEMDAVAILEDGAPVARWRYAKIRRVDGPPGALRVRAIGAPDLARLELAPGKDARALIARCVDLDAAAARRHTLKIALWSVAAAVSIVVVTLFGVPLAADRLAPLVPPSLEIRLGEAVDGQVRAAFGSKACASPAGAAAFAKLTGALKRQGVFATPVEAAVLPSRTANAFALPGGRIYVLDGLIQKAETPDELAGVMAHEMGHVRHRHGLRSLIQAGGAAFLLGLLFGDVAGSGAVVLMARTLLDASYSRDSEREADAFAIDAMRGLGRSPKPLGDLLVRITGEESGNLALLRSHPLTQDRLAAVSAAPPATPGPPLLDEAEWRALKAICRAN